MGKRSRKKSRRSRKKTKSIRSKNKKQFVEPKLLTGPTPVSEANHVTTVFQDSGMLEMCRTRWQHGEWQALLDLSLDDIRNDYERGKTAALLASVHSSQGNSEQAKEFFTAAMSWGCGHNVAARLMISATLNTLGRANTTIGDEERAESAFAEAIAIVEPRADVALLGRMRRIRETVDLGFQDEAVALVEDQILNARENPSESQNGLPMIASALDMLEQRFESIKERTGKGSIDLPTQQHLKRPRIIVIASAPRSASTWAYNATRFLLEQAGDDVYATWCAHYRGVIEGDTRTHVVKVHERNQVTFPYDVMITTRRNVIDRIASLIRMGWLPKNEQAIKNAVRGTTEAEEHWITLSEAVIDFDQIKNRPERAIHEIAQALDVPCTSVIAQKVIAQIQAMPEPEKEYDPFTLLHPGHNSDGTETAELAAWVRDFFEKHDIDPKQHEA